MTLIRAERVHLAKSKQGTATGHFPVQARLLKQCSGCCPMTPVSFNLQAVPGRRQNQAEKTLHRSPPLGQTVDRRTLTSNQARQSQAFPVRVCKTVLSEVTGRCGDASSKSYSKVAVVGRVETTLFAARTACFRGCGNTMNRPHGSMTARSSRRSTRSDGGASVWRCAGQGTAA